MPDCIIDIWGTAFDKCNNLTHINIPKGSKEKFKKLLPEEYHSKLYEQ